VSVTTRRFRRCRGRVSVRVSASWGRSHRRDVSTGRRRVLSWIRADNTVHESRLVRELRPSLHRGGASDFQYRVKLSADAITDRRARRDTDCVPAALIADNGDKWAYNRNADQHRCESRRVRKTHRCPSACTSVVAHLSITACVSLFWRTVSRATRVIETRPSVCAFYARTSACEERISRWVVRHVSDPLACCLFFCRDANPDAHGTSSSRPEYDKERSNLEQQVGVPCFDRGQWQILPSNDSFLLITSMRWSCVLLATTYLKVPWWRSLYRRKNRLLDRRLQNSIKITCSIRRIRKRESQ